MEVTEEITGEITGIYREGVLTRKVEGFMYLLKLICMFNTKKCSCLSKESSSVIRDALREMLSSCRITTSAGLNTTIHALLDNLKKYTHDCQSIWQ